MINSLVLYRNVSSVSLYKFESSVSSVYSFLCSRYESLVDCVTEAYVTIDHQWCCVTLSVVENMLIRFCAGIFKYIFYVLQLEI